MKILRVKQSDGDLFLDLSDFSDIVDISKVESYTLEEVDDDGRTALILKFYDKDNNVIEVKSKDSL